VGEEVKRCAEKLEQEGVDLTRYNTREVVQDLLELQDKLGIEQWVLFGESYGTRPAMVFMRDYAERVESAVLAGVSPPWVGRGGEWYRHIDRVFDSLEEACEANEDCAKRYPNIKSTLVSVLKAAKNNPHRMRVSGSVPIVYKAAIAKIDDAEILFWLSFQLSWSDGITAAPSLIDAMSNGDYASLGNLMAHWPLYEEPYFTQGAHWSIRCNDAPHLRADLLNEQAETLTYMSDLILREIDRDICKTWPHSTDFALSTRPGDYATEADFALSTRPGDYATEVPTLILTGDFDMPTPKEWADETARVLPRGVIVNIPAAGHNYRIYSCAQRAVDSFLKDTGKTPDVICTEDENKLVFN
jgi:pimeloyl-ACP methyl ester carboxylesterase